MIYLNCEVKSGLGENTFWTWFENEFPGCSFETPKKLNNDDILLRYSTLGFLPIEGKQVSLCWELYPQMKRLFLEDQWDERLKKIIESARYSTYRTVATIDSIDDYKSFGSVDVIPIGVDTELYKPTNNKSVLRAKYDLPINKKIGIWIGTNHPMKGYSDLILYAANNPDVYLILIWKWNLESLEMDNARNYVQIPQKKISELINASDFFISTGKIRPYFMSEWEAMACDIPFVHVGNKNREFKVDINPRNKVLELGWDRNSVKKRWEKYFIDRGITW